MQQDHNAPPLNPLPGVVWLLTLPIIAMEVVLNLGERGLAGGPMAVGWRMDAVQRFAFSPDYMRYMWDNGLFTADGMMRFVTYPFVHGNFTHALMVIVMLLALGKMVGEVFRPLAVLAVFFGAAVMGALAFGLVPGNTGVLIGAYPAVYGLIGAFTFMIWVRLIAQGANQYRAFTMIGFLLGAQLLFGQLFGGSYEWVADLAGFATGFFLSFAVSPGGWGHVVKRLRQR